ncbi:Thiol:disulfide interchange protein DsbD [uncultured archaeon]|nr:Thiol:disulfide interchange protein DsbD [uncultured archaeon]
MRKDTKLYLALVVIVILIISGIFIYKNYTKETPEIKLMSCIASKATLYSSKYCPHCQNQKEILGSYLSLFKNIDCLDNPQKCDEAGVSQYPTWVVNGKLYPGVRSITELKALTNCEGCDINETNNTAKTDTGTCGNTTESCLKPIEQTCSSNQTQAKSEIAPSQENKKPFTIVSIVLLAIVNAMNPCALAALVMVLISILIANEEKKYKVLLGGLMFILAVFIGYFIYGVVILQLFRSFADFTSSIAVYVKSALAIGAIILGLFNIKDYIRYNPGGIATEMPLRFRPRLKQIIKTITSPKGAFVAGLLVTLFLLPCTMGPYLIALGNLSEQGAPSLLSAIPYLLLYNAIFVIPMIIITIVTYLGFSSAEKVSEWRDRNIKKIHLAAGIILVGLGIAILTGLI